MSKGSYVFVAIAIIVFASIFNYAMLDNSSGSRGYRSGGGVYGGGVGGHK